MVPASADGTDTMYSTCPKCHTLFQRLSPTLVASRWKRRPGRCHPLRLSGRCPVDVAGVQRSSAPPLPRAVRSSNALNPFTRPHTRFFGEDCRCVSICILKAVRPLDGLKLTPCEDPFKIIEQTTKPPPTSEMLLVVLAPSSHLVRKNIECYRKRSTLRGVRHGKAES